MSFPLLINLTALIAFIGGMMLPTRLMFVAWAYAFLSIYAIERFYPTYFNSILPN